MRLAFTSCVLALAGCVQQGPVHQSPRGPEGGTHPSRGSERVYDRPPERTPVRPSERLPERPPERGRDRPPERAPLPPHTQAREACPNFAQVMAVVPYPGEAVAANIKSGKVVLEFAVGRDGRIQDVEVVSATHPVFVNAAVRQVQALRCAPTGRNPRLQVMVDFFNGVD